MKRKKSGASLIVVVIIFMFIFTVSTAMLSMVATNYKSRIAESKRVENLYASDSGLDVAYNIIGKTFDAATKYGYYEVALLKKGENNGPNNEKYMDIEDDITSLNGDLNNFKNETPTDTRKQTNINNDIVKTKNLIEEDENMKELLVNEEFKRAFKNFILETDTSQLGNETAPNKLIYSIKNHKFVNGVTLDNIDTNNFEEETIDLGIKNKDGNPPNLDAVVSEEPTNVSSTVEKIEGKSDGGEHYESVSFNVYGEQYYDISVSSSFYTERIAENDTNKRQLQATYKMLVPNYKDIYFANSNGELNEYLATKDRALTIYGDMNVNNVSGLTVDGEIFVQGSNDHSADDRVYGKYFGGITVKNSDSVQFKKNVITRGTFNIQNTASDKKTTEIDENLYARNIYVGKVTNDDNRGLASGPSLLDISKGETIVNNDLALNANNATINIKDFYGINDENDLNKAQSSSSIIVNGNNDSAININESAYMMGTAHIATVGDYQTAESGAVKGNYIAYSIPLNETDKFAYYNPLQLLEADQGAKESHFIQYWSKDGNNANAGGIHWPIKDGNIDSSNIWSVGAIVYETNEDVEINGESQKKSIIIPSHYEGELELSGKIYEEREDFAKYVYKFGQTANINDYNNTIVTDFSSLIDTSKIPSNYILTEQQNKGEYAIFNNDSGKEVKIITGSENEIDTSDPNIIKIQVGKDQNNKYTLNAVIATSGKVSIESDDITINGCIIAEGDLNINGNNVTINYTPDVIGRVQAQNVDTFNAVFGEGILMDTNNTADSNTSDANNANANYNLKNFLENKLWKIFK